MHEGTVAKAAAPRLLFVALTACAQLTFGSALAQGEFSSVPSSYSGDENKNGSPDPFLYDQQIQYDRWQINNVYRTPSRASYAFQEAARAWTSADASSFSQTTSSLRGAAMAAPSPKTKKAEAPEKDAEPAGAAGEGKNKLKEVPTWGNPPTGEHLDFPNLTCKEEWCTSPGAHGKGHDCWAGGQAQSGDYQEPCSCKEGTAVQLDQTIYNPEDGFTSYRYVCCKKEPDEHTWDEANPKEKHRPNFTGEKCGAYEQDLKPIFLAIVAVVSAAACAAAEWGYSMAGGGAAAKTSW
eukprot:CAMPEP_0179004804 /NCGR_PEP_ID=MMETSP0795-20121207/13530_1 /TAXON_ID=88552 /ORGANISM="Amoebophrya sp., Strain Ameob2" /LENGTH=293 /DNA_ID=CAMNT_0020699151 /DNA_START=249 /DNA_END=1129 /DNA_ORIENTATION=+